MENFNVVIGIEIHIQLNTKTKAFCRCSTSSNILKPNQNICPICVGEPGTLPNVNREIVLKGIKIGLALNCKVNSILKFDRKNYFYPDLPKGYQITQYDMPIAYDGYIEIPDENLNFKKIGIERVHLEEDTAKMLHYKDYNITYIDFNRAGIPLVEIVSKPDIKSPVEAANYVKQIKREIEYTETSTCSLEDGSMRCDINVSVNEPGKPLSYKVEIKNLNSISSIKKALEYEIELQKNKLRRGEKIETETKLYDVEKEITISMRSKELASDYRYFPEPDIPLVSITNEIINEVKAKIYESPNMKIKRFINDYKISFYYADIIISRKDIANYYEEAVSISQDPVKTANYLISDIFGVLNDEKKDFSENKLSSKDFGLLIKKLNEGSFTQKSFKENLPNIIKGNLSVDDFLNKNIKIVDENFISSIIDKVIDKERDDAIKKYLNGKTSVFGYLVGEIMKETKGQADTTIVNKVLKDKLNKIGK
ncbi:MAG: Asp-tRNA(Asn)/Glu-tRNA(Gln) amidotransferase subunit GatB [Spirochaetes bacterium]|nr:Asp-tRNA(Asn)/Glu-tRNA(Gln) amidotransferase subunit GatB [Spirochaetota bacterium]